MLTDFYQKAIDDVIIDSVCQPLCDKVRGIFGWTKRVLAALTIALSVVCYLYLVIDCVLTGKNGSAVVFLAVVILVQAWKIYRLLSEERNSHRQEQPHSATAMNSARVRNICQRRILFWLFLLFLPLLLVAMTIPALSLIAGSIATIMLMDLLEGWFQACTDLPHGKTAIEKLREQIANFSLHPEPLPAR